MAAAAVDTAYLAGHLGLPVTSLEALSTDDATTAFLKAVAAKAREFDDLYASKIRVDIELENAVIGSESRCQSFKATADQALNEVGNLNQKLQAEESLKNSLQNELQALKSSYADAESEIRTLRTRVETLQESNRANMTLFESHSLREREISEELARQHEKNVALSKELTELQQASQTAQSQTSAAKYRAEVLQQKFDLEQNTSKFHKEECDAKKEELQKVRREKSARISELQRANDDATAEIESLKRSEKQLRERLDAAQTKAEDTMLKLQRQQESFARTEESYKQELENQRRLVDMSDQLSRKHQDRLHDMELEKERIRDNFEAETNAVRVELEKERQNVADLEARVTELQSEVDELHARLEHALTSAPAGNSEVPVTPSRPMAIGRAMSPFTPGNIRRNNGLTVTQAVEELFKVKGQLNAEQRRTEQLTAELDECVNMLEARGPEMSELQAECNGLREELERMSELSTKNFAERDNAVRQARKAQSALGTVQAENKIYQTQIRDLSTQIQMLVFYNDALERDMKLTDEECFRFEQLARGETSIEALSDMSDTHRFITERFVVFKNIHELQEKNKELLQITRDLADNLESDEAVAQRNQAVEDHKAVQELQQELQYMTDEAKSLKATMESYKSERDTFRRLLQKKATASELGSAFGGEEERAPLASIEAGAVEEERISKDAIAQLQVTFDSFREEQTSVRETLNNQIRQLSSEKTALQSEIAKYNSQITFASERYDMLQSNYNALQTEMAELQKRNATLNGLCAKQDIRTQQVAEELVESRGLLESMRNEAANLKAEKKLWKDIQERLSKDNEALLEEKSRLSNLLANQQSLLNEKDLSEAEARRKTQARIETLETELNFTKQALAKEVEETKQLQLRKEFDSKEAQKRIDDLTKSLSTVREEHVAAKTARDQLKARVDELTINLRNAEERAGRLAPRPTPRPGMPVEATTADEDAEQRIIDLENEVGDLKRDLEIAQSQVENANAQIEQYKSIAQNAEEALNELTSTIEIVQAENDKAFTDKDAQIKELQQRVQDISQELANSNTELTTLRDAQLEVSRRFDDEKAILDDEVRRLKEQTQRYKEEKKFHQQDLRAQADIAAKAQQDYEVELVKHAEAAKLVQTLRNQLNKVKSETAELKTSAESARVALEQSRASWEERHSQMEREISELTARREDVNQQNKLLHKQLDSITQQISSLQQTRSVGAAVAEGAAVASVPAIDVEGLRELNTFLRREKEIAEIQFDLKVQEAKRLQQQLEYAQSQLDDCRLKLEQERRSAADSGKASISHQDLMTKLNELNLYRESSVTLRNELGVVRGQLTRKTRQIEELEARLAPLETNITELQTQKSYLEDEIKQVQEDRDRWQKRTEGILTKYGRVDPAEQDQLKAQVTELTTQLEAAKQASVPLQEQITALEAEKARWAETREKIISQAKERSRKLTSEKNDVINEKNTIEARLTEVTAELTTAKATLESTQASVTQLQGQITSLQNQLSAAPADNMTVNGGNSAENSQAVAALEERVNALTQEIASITEAKANYEKKLQTANTERDDALKKLEFANACIASATNATVGAPAPAPVTTPAAPATTGSPFAEDEKKAYEERIAAAQKEAAELKTRLEEIEGKINETIKTRSDKMRELLNNKLKESKQKLQDEFDAKMNAEVEIRVQQQKVIWEAEHQVSSAEGMSPVKMPQPSVPATPATPSGPKADNPKDFEAALQHLKSLGDDEIRSYLSQNNTLKSIMSHNLRVKVAAETNKVKSELESSLKSEYEAKIAQAREQGQNMEAKKFTVKMNMNENKLRVVNHKLELVEAASKETPQKPVIEVWLLVKDARPPPVQKTSPSAAKANSPASQPTSQIKPPTAGMTTAAAAAAVANKPSGIQPPSQPATAAAPAPAAAGTTPTQAQQTPAPAQPQAQTQTQSQPAPVAAATALKQTPSIPGPASTSGTQPAGQTAPANASQAPVANSFASSIPVGQSKPLVNPFASSTPATSQPGQSYQPASSLPTPMGSMLPTPGGRSGLPVMRGGAQQRGRGNMRGGRGGQRGGISSGLNPGATDFQPGSKRPGDGQQGGQGKRPRGAH